MLYRSNATAGGAAMAYLDLGEPAGPARVYLGGLGSAGTVAFATVATLPQLVGGRHILVDFVGSGWSDHDDTFGHTVDEHAATVAALIEQIGPRDPELVGHSLGGSVAIALAATRPDLVGRLVVAEPNLDPGVGTVSTVIARQDEDEFVRTGHTALVEEIRRSRAPRDAQYARTLHRWSARGLHRTAVSLLAARPATFRAQLTTFAGPKRYLTGELTGEDLTALRATGSDVRVVAGAGHSMQSDNPDGVATALTTP